MSVVIETTIGDITVDLFIEERPQTCLNFLKLCKLKYYNYNLFHNIERNFIAQTGDPSGAGNGGQSIWGILEGPHKRFFEAESIPKIKHEIPGLISLVSIGKNMVSSQFFFTLGQDLISLDNIHCVIGEVVEGHDVLRKLNEAIVDEKFRPYQDIRITHTVILDDPFIDPRGFRMPSRSPSPSAERLKNGRIAADENIDDTEGKTAQEIQEMLAEREAKARATILEIIGDLPDAEIAPPENVLFVCKLNPVTTEDDLEIIFSRFGKIVGCEVIKDKVSGDSLQYAFVEFKDKKSCEAAYFKMDNVLIDDRRIHVDFSQSVAKVQWKGKGRGLIYKDGKEDRNLDFNNYKERKQYKGNKQEFRENRYEKSQRMENLSRKSENNPTKKSRSRSSEKYYSRDRDNSKRFHNYRRDHFRTDRRSRSRSRNRNLSNSKHRKHDETSYDNLRDINKNERRDFSRNRNRSRSPHKMYPPRHYDSKRDYNNVDEKRNKERKRNQEELESTSTEKNPNKYSRHESSEDRYKTKDSYNKRYEVLNKKIKKKTKRKKDKKSKNLKKKKSSESESTDSSSNSNSSFDSKLRNRKKSKKNKRRETSSSSESSDSS